MRVSEQWQPAKIDFAGVTYQTWWMPVTGEWIVPGPVALELGRKQLHDVTIRLSTEEEVVE